MNRENLEEIEVVCSRALSLVQNALIAWDAVAEHNVFSTLDGARGTIEELLIDQAMADCEGSDTCGAEQYSREFLVAGTKYVGILDCEYDRYNKTYYYLENYEFSYREIV